MTGFLSDPAARVLTISALVSVANLMGVWFGSGAARGKTKMTPNPEDTSTIVKGATANPVDPPEVARVLRAHTNSIANMFPFYLMAILYVMAGCSEMEAWILFGSFAGFRVLYTIAYAAAKQPWRTLMFVGGTLSLLGLFARLTMKLLAG
jgi:prostaglandin-E synthase 1